MFGKFLTGSVVLSAGLAGAIGASTPNPTINPNVMRLAQDREKGIVMDQYDEDGLMAVDAAQTQQAEQAAAAQTQSGANATPSVTAAAAD